MQQTYLIAIGGPSCAGKTELAKYLARALSGTILPLDAYYLDLSHLPLQERARFNFDIPEALDYSLLAQNLRGLAAGQAVERPVYDFATHTRTPLVERVEAGQYLIFEGLFTLHWDDLRPLFGTKVYVEAPDRLCLDRRQVRDVRERGRTVESVQRQYAETVRPMAERYVHPTRDFADVIVSGKAPLEVTGAEVLRHVHRKTAGFSTAPLPAR